MVTDEQHQAMVQALATEHRREVVALETQLALYREALEDAGIEPPDRGGQDLLQIWRRAAAVVSTTSDFVAELGTAKELLTERLGGPVGL